MNIGRISNGYVIDHIKAGRSMDIYEYLNLDKLECTVALLKNVPSAKMGSKDIIKIDSLIELNLDVLGYIDEGITVNVIKDGKRVKKMHLELPQTVREVIKCKNPRCITSTEREIEQVFRLSDREKRTYRCIYCDTKAKKLSDTDED